MQVKTGNKDLRFRVQGKWVDSESPISVSMDHNVFKKLQDGSLVEAKPEAPKVDKKEKSKYKSNTNTKS
ncbi:MAG: hypothetical protein KAI70_00685 [Candidatus Omnitrophica bacterium]|nr:hypothetical protein [Candidatus Omnitrophota bacterium]